MKKIHVHVAVEKLKDSIDFYSAIFGETPTIERDDYAKWQLDNPPINFAISQRGMAIGVNHLGIQVDTESDLREIAQRMEQAGISNHIQENAECCYARSNKYWAEDPQGVAWESFHTLDEISVFGEHKHHGELSTCCESNLLSDSCSGAQACC